MIVYLHGFNSSPQSHKAQVMQRYMAQRGLAAQFACPALPPEADEALRIIREVVRDRQPVCYVGSSLGGFYATHLVEHEGGRAVLINPAIVDGQIRGGVVHGSGNALFERMIYDEAGQPLTTTYADYFLPLASEMPPIEIHHMETPSPRNPIGVKGAGEGGTIPAAACVISAVEDALGSNAAFINLHPISPQQVVEWIKAI